ncbi:MAG: hypothetical protein LBQ46_06900 [Treponema sp.]|nr:hypothetical protein [Treponema sp.]
MFLTDELDGREPKVDEGAQIPVRFGEGFLLKIGVKTGISYHFSHHFAVFLFDKTIVVFAVEPAAGELDLVFSTPGQELPVDDAGRGSVHIIYSYRQAERSGT